jgi:hypothetical protein
MNKQVLLSLDCEIHEECKFQISSKLRTKLTFFGKSYIPSVNLNPHRAYLLEDHHSRTSAEHYQNKNYMLLLLWVKIRTFFMAIFEYDVLMFDIFKHQEDFSKLGIRGILENGLGSFQTFLILQI